MLYGETRDIIRIVALFEVNIPGAELMHSSLFYENTIDTPATGSWIIYKVFQVFLLKDINNDTRKKSLCVENK